MTLGGIWIIALISLVSPPCMSLQSYERVTTEIRMRGCVKHMFLNWCTKEIGPRILKANGKPLNCGGAF